jgi:hypothetical protein
MIKSRQDEKELVKDLLCLSFDDNQSVNYIIQQDKRRQKRIRTLMEYSIDVCSLFGEVLLSENKKACVLILYPQLKRTTIKSIWLDLKLIFVAIGISGIGKAIKRQALIKGKQPKKPITYLWFIGVNPLCQHNGIGTQLLKEVLAAADKKGLPVYLETSTQQNVPWYRRFGFIVYDELALTYILHFLKYEPVR